MSEYFRKYVRKEPPPCSLKFRSSFHNTVYDVLKARGFKETDADLDWDIFWCDKEWIYDVFDQVHLQPNQRVNHYRNHYELTRKDLLVKNLKRAKRIAEKEGNFEEAASYSFFPSTYVVPLEYSLFMEEFKKQADKKSIWIMKPVGKAQGKGIFLVDRISQLADWKSETRWKPENPQAEPYVVQKYITDPLLIGGKKFDLRMYVLVTSYSPLTIYIYRSGFARFSHTRFTMDASDITNSMVHLTNVAVQKNSDNYDENKGGKWSLQNLKTYLLSKNDVEQVDALFEQMTSIIIASCAAVQKVIIQDKHCFELYGYDIIIDEKLKPWLLEVNASPSLTANTPADYELKFGMLDDVLSIIDMERYFADRPPELQIGGFDLVYRGSRIQAQPNAVFKSRIGCRNNRQSQMKKLARAIALEKPKKTSGRPRD